MFNLFYKFALKKQFSSISTKEFQLINPVNGVDLWAPKTKQKTPAEL